MTPDASEEFSLCLSHLRRPKILFYTLLGNPIWPNRKCAIKGVSLKGELRLKEHDLNTAAAQSYLWQFLPRITEKPPQQGETGALDPSAQQIARAIAAERYASAVGAEAAGASPTKTTAAGTAPSPGTTRECDRTSAEQRVQPRIAACSVPGSIVNFPSPPIGKAPPRSVPHQAAIDIERLPGDIVGLGRR
jgi:hypothetical protein